MNNQKQKILKYLATFVFIPFLLLGVRRHFPLIGASYYIADSSLDTSNKELSSGFDEDEDSLLESNPLELLDIWRRTTAMEDATSPSDALDEAIKAFEGKDLQTPF